MDNTLYGFFIFFSVVIPFLVLVLIVEFIKANFSMLGRSITDIIVGLRVERAQIQETNHMTGREFEVWLYKLFKKLGYKVELQKGFKDRGADLILTNKHGTRTAVQAKKLAKGKVGVKALGEVLRAKHNYNCQIAIVVTNQYFTEQAIEEAKNSNIELWDRKMLMKALARVNKAA